MNPKNLLDISDEERGEFRDAVAQIKDFKRVVYKTPTIEPVSERVPFYTSSEISTEISGDDKVHFQREGLQFRLLQRFKRGKIMPQASLDLHRLTVAQAAHEVASFIDLALARHYRCVHLIHGKGRMTKDGYAKLKNWLNQWLRQHPSVLAFTSAHTKDGGTGAVYVLLKNGARSKWKMT